MRLVLVIHGSFLPRVVKGQQLVQLLNSCGRGAPGSSAALLPPRRLAGVGAAPAAREPSLCQGQEQGLAWRHTAGQRGHRGWSRTFGSARFCGATNCPCVFWHVVTSVPCHSSAGNAWLPRGSRVG